MSLDENNAGPVPDAHRAWRKDVFLRWVLGVLVCVGAIFGVRGWRMLADVQKCERTFVHADACMEKKHWDEAEASLDQCIALNPLYFPAYEAKALIKLDVRKDKQAALAVLTAALPHLPSDARLQRAIGELYLRGLDDQVQAQIYLARACELDPTDRTTRGLLAQARAGSTRPGSPPDASQMR